MASILEREVSLFASYTEAVPRTTIALQDWILSAEYRSEVTAIRSSKLESIKKAKKQKLPAITPSGIFEGKRAASNLLNHSGIICIDIDGKDNQHIKNWNTVKKELGKFSNMAYCGLSVSGNGLFVLMPIAYPDKHELHFLALQQFFKTRLNIIVDAACKDVCRLRGISYDPDPYLNQDCEVFTGLASIGGEKFGSNKRLRDTADLNTIQPILDAVLTHKIDITQSYSDWVRIGFALASSFGEDGRVFFHRLSMYNTKYDKPQCDKQYTACLRNNNNTVSLGSLYYISNKYL